MHTDLFNALDFAAESRFSFCSLLHRDLFVIIADAREPFFTLYPEIHRRFKSFEMVSLFVTRLKRQQTFVPFRCCLDFLNVSLDSRSMFDVQFVSYNSIGFQIGILNRRLSTFDGLVFSGSAN